MYYFGKTSLNKYNRLHPDLQIILSEVIKFYDFSIIDGLRTLEQQQKLFNNGRSKLDGINIKSKHQGKLHNENLVSYAVDIIPYKKGTNAFSGKEKDNRRFYNLMGMVKAVAYKLLSENKISHEIRFGLDWDKDDIFDDQNFDDLPHLELVKI